MLGTTRQIDDFTQLISVLVGKSVLRSKFDSRSLTWYQQEAGGWREKRSQA